MRQVVSHLYAEYGRYIDSFRAIPKAIDCLKPSERRLLLTVHNVAKNKPTKSAKVVGACLSLHPHGDTSTYGVLVGLVNRGFIEGSQGNWGNPGWENSSPAAMRYTECKANKILDDGFSEFLKYVPWDVLEIEEEPLYLPYPIPIGLIGNGAITGIGFHTTKIPRYNLIDLVNRLLQLVNHQPLTTIKPVFTNCTVLEDSPGEFENILSKGSGKLKIIPKHTVSTTEIWIYGYNQFIGFNRLKKLNESYELEHGVQLFDVIDAWDRKCKDPVKINIKPASKKKLIDQSFSNSILGAISSKENFIVNVVEDNNTVATRSIDELLLLSYNKWKSAKLAHLHERLQSVMVNIEELKVLAIVQKYYIRNTHVINSEDLVTIIKSDPSVIYDASTIRDVLNRYSVKKLIEVNTNIAPLQKKAAEIQHDINNIDTVAVNTVKSMFGIK